jgi:choline dehydrogenase-like flavoprotein
MTALYPPALRELRVICEIEQLESRLLAADVCIVGAGPAGLTVARELDGGPLRVVVVEAGRRRTDGPTQALYRSDVVGLPHGGIHGYRLRGLGGSTVAWAGQVLPFFDIDFEQRDWVPYSGWPLSRDDLEPGYRRMAALLDVPPFPREPGTWPDGLDVLPPLEPGALEAYYSEFSPHPNFAEMIAPSLGRSVDVTVVLGANVVELVPDSSGGAVDVVAARSLEGLTLDVEARFVVLCCGGIETARVLLASRRRSDAGIGNEFDNVGRFFQDHPGFVVGALKLRRRDLARTFAPRRIKGVKHAPRLRVSDALQRRERILHVGANLVFDLSQSASIRAGKLAFHALRTPELRRRVPRALLEIARDPVPLVRAVTRYFVRGDVALDTMVQPLLAVGGEQSPNPDSRVVLLGESDQLGVPRLALDWRLTAADIASYRRVAELAVTALEDAGIGSLEGDDLLLSELSAIDSGHHMGTTRMADDPRHGVVDAECRVFGVENLYVASCSVFPTSGIANPTFTMLALCLRVAATIRART